MKSDKDDIDFLRRSSKRVFPAVGITNSGSWPNMVRLSFIYMYALTTIDVIRVPKGISSMSTIFFVSEVLTTLANGQVLCELIKIYSTW